MVSEWLNVGKQAKNICQSYSFYQEKISIKKNSDFYYEIFMEFIGIDLENCKKNEKWKYFTGNSWDLREKNSEKDRNKFTLKGQNKNDSDFLERKK